MFEKFLKNKANACCLVLSRHQYIILMLTLLNIIGGKNYEKDHPQKISRANR